jgi:TolB-like protein
MRIKLFSILLAVGMLLGGWGARAQTPTTATLKAGAPDGLTVAVFDFSSRDSALNEAGAVLAEMVRVQLQGNGRLRLVAREEMDKILGEQKLTLAGVTEEAAPKVGKLLGAQVLVLGRVFKLGGDVLATANVVGVETGRVYGEMARGGQDRIDTVGTELGQKVAGLIDKGAETLVAKVRLTGEQIAQLKAKLAGKPLPRVFVFVRESVVNIHVPDPAAQTEIAYILKKIGCEVVKDSGGTLAAWATAYLDGGNQTAPPTGAGVDLVLVGEGLSQFASRTGDLVSSRARVELEALGAAGTNGGKVLAVDRETFVGVDLSEQIAAKSALQEAAARLALRVVPEAVEAWRAGAGTGTAKAAQAAK